MGTLFLVIAVVLVLMAGLYVNARLSRRVTLADLVPAAAAAQRAIDNLDHELKLAEARLYPELTITAAAQKLAKARWELDEAQNEVGALLARKTANDGLKLLSDAG